MFDYFFLQRHHGKRGTSIGSGLRIKLKMASATSTETLNRMRFRNQATKILKYSASEGVDPSVMSQISGSIGCIEATGQAGSENLEFKELQDLVKQSPISLKPSRTLKSRRKAALEDVEEPRTRNVDSLPDPHTGSIRQRTKQQRQENTDFIGAEAEAEKTLGSAAETLETTSGNKIASLLQQSQHISTLELEHEQAKHEQLVSEVGELVGSLKDAALLMNKFVVEQNLQLDDMAVMASENVTELSDQQDKMKRQTKEMSSSVWTTLGTVMWLLGLFSLTYAIMRLFPKP